MSPGTSTPPPRDPSTERTHVGAVEVLPQPDVLIAAQAAVGEGPVIDHRTARLCWVDIVEGMLYENDLSPERAVSA